MNYDELKAAELKVLCEERGIKPSRAKHDMIADLKDWDASNAPVPPVEEVEVPLAQEEPTKPAQRPVEPLVRSPGAEWVEDGVFLKEFDRNYTLEEYEHQRNLNQVVGAALGMRLHPYGPPYRVASRTNAFKWVYGVNVRQED